VIGTRIAAGFLLLAALAGLAGCGRGTDPERLEPGDCFDLPATTDRIGDVTQRDCSAAHAGEAFHVFEASGEAAAYPSDTDWERIVYPVCDPEFEAYTGTFVADRLDIDYRYFVPTAESWGRGDRQVSCFIVSPDGSPLGRSHRAVP
jgi:hypothetical protein